MKETKLIMGVFVQKSASELLASDEIREPWACWQDLEESQPLVFQESVLVCWLGR